MNIRLWFGIGILVLVLTGGVVFAKLKSQSNVISYDNSTGIVSMNVSSDGSGLSIQDVVNVSNTAITECKNRGQCKKAGVDYIKGVTVYIQ